MEMIQDLVHSWTSVLSMSNIRVVSPESESRINSLMEIIRKIYIYCFLYYGMRFVKEELLV
jgi:hypothetical protein